jgi:hypothetical protein
MGKTLETTRRACNPKVAGVAASKKEGMNFLFAK